LYRPKREELETLVMRDSVSALDAGPMGAA